MSLRNFDLIEELKPIGGGWRYQQVMRDGSLQRIPTSGGAPTGSKLVEMVRQMRINEGLDLGDYERDVAEYIRRVSPNNDRFRGKGSVLNQPRPEPFIPLIQRLREWLDGLGPRRPQVVQASEANPRALICINCPQNVKWETSCGECNDAVKYLGATLRGVPNYGMDEALLGCRLHGIHLPSAVFIDRDYLPARLPTAPEACWLPKPTP